MNLTHLMWVGKLAFQHKDLVVKANCVRATCGGEHPATNMRRVVKFPLKMDHRANRLAFVHQIKGVIDLI